MSVPGTLVDRSSSRLAGPADTTSLASGAVVYDRPSGSKRVESVRAERSLKTPTVDTVWGSVAVGSVGRSEEHTSELQSLMRISYAVFCLKKKQRQNKQRAKSHT